MKKAGGFLGGGGEKKGMTPTKLGASQKNGRGNGRAFPVHHGLRLNHLTLGESQGEQDISAGCRLGAPRLMTFKH